MPVLGWDAHIVDAEIRHAYATLLACEPEDAVRAAMDRARQKYGDGVDFTAWDLRADPVPAGSGKTVRFACQRGELRRVG
jgi:hypothetical protein